MRKKTKEQQLKEKLEKAYLEESKEPKEIAEENNLPLEVVESLIKFFRLNKSKEIIAKTESLEEELKKKRTSEECLKEFRKLKRKLRRTPMLLELPKLGKSGLRRDILKHWGNFSSFLKEGRLGKPRPKGKNKHSENFRRLASEAAIKYYQKGKWSRSEEKVARILIEELGLVENLDWWHNFKVKSPSKNGSFFELDFYLPRFNLVIECDSFWHCYSSDTEVFTVKGWKSFDEVKIEEEVWSLDKEHHLIKVPIKRKFVYEIDDFLLRIANSKIDLLITLNHRIYLRKQHSKKWLFIKAKNLPMNFHLFNSCRWQGKLFTPPFNLSLRSWLRFIAWWLTEGTLYRRKKPKHYWITIVNKKDISEIFKTLKWKIQTWTNKKELKHWRICSKELFEYLESFWKPKRIPQEIKNLPKEELRFFIRELLKGDDSGKTFHTSSKDFRNDFWEICLKAGFPLTEWIDFKERNSFGKKINYHLRISGLKSKKDFTQPRIRASSLCEILPLKGKVFCLNVPSSLLFVKRNGKAVWCGNSLGESKAKDDLRDAWVKEFLNCDTIRFDSFGQKGLARIRKILKRKLRKEKN